jgi:hypothetical protein
MYELSPAADLYLSLVDEQYDSRMNKATRTMLKELEKVMNEPTGRNKDAHLETLNGQGKKEQSFVLFHSTFYTALSARRLA